MPLLSFQLDESDILYEEEIIKNKYSPKVWLRYLDYKKDSPQSVRNLIYERALKEIPGSYKVWYAYLRERRGLVRYKSPLDPTLEDLNNAYERCLVFLHKMPRLWTEYLTFMSAQHKITKTRRLFDRCLRALPITQHHRIWPLYLKFVRQYNIPETTVRICRRYLQLEPYDVEDYIDYLKSVGKFDEAATRLATVVNDDHFASKRGKTPHQFWTELCELLSTNAAHITSLKAEPIIRSGLVRFTDMVGHLWVALAEHFTRLKLFEKARDIYEEALSSVMTVRDFTLVFDAYSQFEELLLRSLFENLGLNEQEPVDDVDLDLKVARFENLMDRRPILLSSVLLRQNPHNVNEWLKRALLFSSNPLKVIETYTKAVHTVDPHKATGKLCELWISFAEFYEEHDQLHEARAVFDKAVTRAFKKYDELATVWCEYVEMELRNKEFRRAVSLIKQATNQHVRLTPGDPANYVRSRLYRSLKIWQLYLDLEESFGTFESVKSLYSRVLSLKVATPIVVINFAKFLQDHNCYEESFKVYERGVSLFKWPQVYDLYLYYIQDFLQRHGKELGGSMLERARDIFEQALEACPSDYAKTLFLMYAQMEEDHGLARRAMNIYERAVAKSCDTDKLELFRVYIKRAASLYGVTRTREIYEKALEDLGDKDATTMCLEFAALEVKLGEVDRARAVYSYGSQFNDPRTSLQFWKAWNDFEVNHGNEATFRDMLRLKRSVQASYSTRVSVEHALEIAKFLAANSEHSTTFVSVPSQEQEIAASRSQKIISFVASECQAHSEIQLSDSDSEEADKVEQVEIVQKDVPNAIFGSYTT